MNKLRATLLPKATTIGIVAIGPALSVWFVNYYLSTNLIAGDTPLAMLVVLAMWSPLFFSIPAFLMQDGRDSIKSNATGLGRFLRAVKLPFLMFKKENGMREVTIASYVGFAAGVFAALPHFSALMALLA